MTEMEKEVTEMAQFKVNRMDKCVLGAFLILYGFLVARYFELGDISPDFFSVIQGIAALCLAISHIDVFKCPTIPKPRFYINLLLALILFFTALSGR